jgi:hypothetical protein
MVAHFSRLQRVHSKELSLSCSQLKIFYFPSVRLDVLIQVWVSLKEKFRENILSSLTADTLSPLQSIKDIVFSECPIGRFNSGLGFAQREIQRKYSFKFDGRCFLSPAVN